METNFVALRCLPIAQDGKTSRKAIESLQKLRSLYKMDPKSGLPSYTLGLEKEQVARLNKRERDSLDLQCCVLKALGSRLLVGREQGSPDD